jgi:hypothetical protein
MEWSRLDRVDVDVAGEIVDISRRDRDALLQELCFVSGCERIRKTFEVAGDHAPVVLDARQRSRLRAVLEIWERDGLRPEGMTGLLVALARADGHLSTGPVDG